MTFDQAIEILEGTQDHLGLPLLETLQEIQANPDDFSDREKRAYRVVMRDMAKLFAPA